MPRLLRIALLCALASAQLYAQPRFAGEPFPLTSTRYGPAAGFPRLVSNGAEVFLFWQTATHFRFTRPAWGNPAPSRVIMENTGGDTWDVVWTGTHFLFVAGQTHFTSPVEDDDIVGQLIDTNGELAGEPFLLADGGQYPHIAFDGASVLMLFYRGDWTHGSHVSEIQALRLKRDGTHAAPDEKVTGVRGVVQSLASNGRSFAAVVSDRFERKVVLFDHDGDTTVTTPLVQDFLGVGRIAGNGDRYLLADAAANSMVTRLVEADGSLGPPLVLDALNGWETPAASIAWADSHWTLAWSTPASGPNSFAIVRLDAEARNVEQRQLSGGTGPSLATAGEQISLAWLPLGSPGIIHIAPGVAASHAATQQKVHATASASHGTLVLWEEGGVLHGGVRTRDGRWSENVVWSQPSFAVAAASDGEGFAVVLTSTHSAFVLRLDDEGKPIGDALAVTAMSPEDVLWTGREYTLIGTHGNDAVATTLTAAGALSDLTKIPSTRLASNGNGFFAVWLLEAPLQTPPLPPMGVEGIRLGPDFQPLDAAPTRFALENAYGCDVAWDGTQYVVAWTGDRGVVAAHVGSPESRIVAEGPVGEVRLTAIAGGAAIDWGSHYRFLLADGTMTPATALRSSNDTQFAPLPDGGVAIVQSVIENGAPVEGSTRVTMSVVSAIPLPQRPQSPEVRAINHGDTMELRWNTPPQPVSGYRVEYRIEDRPWVEIESAMTPDQTSVVIATQGRKTALRVRAWNDAGLGEYSTGVFVNAGRRRSVR